MTTEQIVKSLRACGRGCCDDCVCVQENVSCKEKNLGAADLIEQQAAKIKELEAKVPRWIPCSERMPSDHVGVLLWDSIDNTTFTGHYSEFGRWDVDGFNDGTFAFKITHWMPLPEGPEEKNDG